MHPKNVVMYYVFCKRFPDMLRDRTVDPSWNESFHFPVGDMSEMLRVSVLDRDRFLDPEFLGRVDIPLMAVARGQAEVQ